MRNETIKRRPPARMLWQLHLLRPRPKECTRRRLKPQIDGCRCSWCRREEELREAMDAEDQP